ncbi:hypothetical protein L211DRAFT_840042 [Terfezia boudieri ATCC MYA-4762]|uniref:Restriction endonuclease domain-containing protein n=1 Tax=Terfezia boudieri ATCC MYA-4762 TaxID=1051890 RepID=A0A3N4LLA9_9PEZI|nr:hypothetical protein L211DRAFT_840042 [Terfezia boudieri ATCC MYA-4762]
MKTPDYAYQPKGAPYPTVVLEVGWTEHPDELYSDAEQWLVKTSGQVQLVITVRFIEYNSPLAEHRKELMNLMSEEVDGVDEDSNSDGALSPAPSTDSDHTLERQQIDPNQ